MTVLQDKAIGYIQKLADDKLNSAIDYLQFLYEQDYPLDDFDYALAQRAEQDTSDDTVAFDTLLGEVGLTHADLSD